MNRQQKTALAIVLVAVVLLSAFTIYAITVFNPFQASGSWQRPIEHFATTLASADGKVFLTDAQGNVECFDAGTGRSIWNGTGLGGQNSAGLVVANGCLYGGMRWGYVGCMDEATGQDKWTLISAFYRNDPPDSIIVNNGRLFVVSKGVSYSVNAADASTGEVL